MRSHINLFKCPLCDMTCASLANLNTHYAYKHSDERPFSCDNCDYRAKTQGDLNLHTPRYLDIRLYTVTA